VDVYVGYLRDKLDRPFDCHSIETVRGVGYRIRQDPCTSAFAASSPTRDARELKRGR
jgi:hypothetical protein